MKKLFLSLFILFLSVGLFAETGYAGTAWNAPQYKTDTRLLKVPGQETPKTTATKIKTILGQSTVIFYHFLDDKLMGVSYTVGDPKANVKSKFHNLVKSFTVPQMSNDDFISMLLEDKTLKSKDDSMMITIQQNEVFFRLAYQLEQFGNDSNYENEKGEIYIFDYNSDTRVYIYENIVEGLTFVVYTYHEQDY